MFYEDGKAFDTTKAIDAAITLTAKAKEFKVTFDSGVEAITVKYNETAKEPTAPTKEDYTFIGWYEGETKFDFATKITKDISLTAKWEEKKAEDPTTPPASGEDNVEEEETLLEVDLPLGTMGWSYNATYDVESKTITLTGNYGQGSTGWNDGANWSAYKSLNVDISEYSNDWGKIVIQGMDDAPIKELEFNTVSEVISMDLTDVDVSAVKQFSIQGKASGDTIVVDRVYFLQIPNVELDLSLGTMGWSYNATYDVESKTITLTGNYGQGSTGWNDGANWSAYKSLNVDISEYSNDWGKIVIQGMDDAPIKELEFNTVSEVISMDLTDVDVSAVKQFSIQGKASGDTIVVDRVYFITK